MAELPMGTVTFLFTDIEGSTRLWEQHPEAMRLALDRHDALLNRTYVADDLGGRLLKGQVETALAALAGSIRAVRGNAALSDPRRAGDEDAAAPIDPLTPKHRVQPGDPGRDALVGDRMLQTQRGDR